MNATIKMILENKEEQEKFIKRCKEAYTTCEITKEYNIPGSSFKRLAKQLNCYYFPKDIKGYKKLFDENGKFIKWISQEEYNLLQASKPKEIKHCEFCGKEHYGEYASGRFCSATCAKSFSTSLNKEENKRKIREGMQAVANEIISYKCIRCGNDFQKSKISGQRICNDCKTKEYEEHLKEQQERLYKSEETKRLNNSFQHSEHLKIEKNKVVRKCVFCGSIKFKDPLTFKTISECPRPEICKHNKLFIETLIKYFGFDSSKIGSLEAIKEFERVRNMVYEDYWDNKMSIPMLIDKYNYQGKIQNFTKILRSLDIPRRSLKESVTLAIASGRINGPQGVGKNYQFKSEWHTSWNGKKFFLRSSYETDYANLLDEQKINYEVESLRILYFDTQLNRQRVAIPDFYLPETNEIVEIKSSWTFDKQNMIDRFQEYRHHGYKVKLILEHKEHIIV